MTIYAYGYSQNSRDLTFKKNIIDQNPANCRDFTNTKTFENVIMCNIEYINNIYETATQHQYTKC